jgi:hypothetical protein
MKRKLPLAAVFIVVIIASGWYMAEPWALTFIDDGPYFATDYAGPVEALPVYSRIELRRFGRTVFSLESRSVSEGQGSVLVLRDTDDSVRWARTPVKPYGELGPIELRRERATWYGGWRIAISPKNQEGGYLYLSTFGGYRFLNHSW